MAKLGDFLTAINLSKKNLMEEDPLTEREYGEVNLMKFTRSEEVIAMYTLLGL